MRWYLCHTLYHVRTQAFLISLERASLKAAGTDQVEFFQTAKNIYFDPFLNEVFIINLQSNGRH